jgi:non-specific serine/threonine protein kinase
MLDLFFSPERCLALLTPREREVADLIALGCTNPQISEALVVSRETTKSHVKSIFMKLGVNSRADVREILNGATQRETT